MVSRMTKEKGRMSLGRLYGKFQVPHKALSDKYFFVFFLEHVVKEVLPHDFVYRFFHIGAVMNNESFMTISDGR